MGLCGVDYARKAHRFISMGWRGYNSSSWALTVLLELNFHLAYPLFHSRIHLL
jgi:hypothetical protein